MSSDQSEIYPMSMFPTFEVEEIRTSIEWYTDVLGFIVIYEMPDPDGNMYMAHLRKEKHQDLILVTAKNHDYDDVIKKGAGVSITFQYVGMAGDQKVSIDDYASRIREAGANVLEGPVNRPWNTREFIVSDPDGYRLIFSAPHQEAIKKDFQKPMTKVRGTLFKSN